MSSSEEDSSNVTIISDVPYVENGNPRQVCDIYIPKNEDNYGKTKSAVILYVHGGGWVRGEKQSAAIPSKLIAKGGFPVVACGYTLADAKQWKNYTVCLEDVASSVSWLMTPKAHSYLNFIPKNIFLAGHSAGGHLSMMLVMQSEWLAKSDGAYKNSASTLGIIRGVIGIGGVYDASLAYETNQDLSEVLHDAFGKDRNSWFSHCPVTCKSDILRDSPVANGNDSHLPDSMPPVLLIHSYEDEIVDSNQVASLMERFESGDSDDGYGPKVDVSKGHYGFHHDMYKNQKLIDTIVSFAKGQLDPDT